MESQDGFVPLELDATVTGEPPHHLGWIVATIALCAAMVLLAAGLVPLALAAGSPTSLPEVAVPTAAAHSTAADAFAPHTAPAQPSLSTP